jgi:ERCC4-type nuclease
MTDMSNILELIIDCRENKIISLIPNYKTEQLDVGDFIYRKNGVTILAIERKTYADLASSIQSGRFYEQKHRLNALNCKFKAYLIEGPYPKKTYGRITPSALDSAIMGLSVRDNFSVIYSNNALHSSKLLVKIIKKLPDWEEGKSSGGNYLQSSISTVKKENNKPEVCYIKQLCQIPGVSITIATTIAKKYKTMISLVLALNNNIEETREILININTGSRKLGKILTNKIISYFPQSEKDQIIKPKIKLKTKINLKKKTSVDLRNSSIITKKI